MIVIDTNVISEMMHHEADRRVLAWSDAVGRLHTTAITLAEVDYGIARLPEGRRKDQLVAAAASLFADFEEMILPFGARAVRRYGSVVADRERAGRPVTSADAQIAAICVAWGATLATRNTDDFVGTGIGLVNPWDGSAHGE